MKTRAVQIFEAYLKSEKTIKHYHYLLEKFTNHYKLGSIDSILSINGVELQKNIEDFIILSKDKKYSMSYIRSNTFAIQSFYFNTIKICENNQYRHKNSKTKNKINPKTVPICSGSKCKKRKTRETQ